MNDQKINITISVVDDYTEAVDKAIDSFKRLSAEVEKLNELMGSINPSETFTGHVVAGINDARSRGKLE